MRVVVVYRDNEDYSRVVDDMMHDLETQTGHTIEIINPDSPEGVQFCAAYGIVEYPTLVAIRNGGMMQNMWRGLPLPTINEISFYTQSE